MPSVAYPPARVSGEAQYTRRMAATRAETTHVGRWLGSELTSGTGSTAAALVLRQLRGKSSIVCRTGRRGGTAGDPASRGALESHAGRCPMRDGGGGQVTTPEPGWWWG